MGRNSHLTSSHWVGPIIICSFGPHQPSLISHTAPRWPSLSNSAQFSFNYDSADLKKYCCLLSKTLNCHSPKDCFLTGNKCPEEVLPCVSHTRDAACVRGKIFFSFTFFYFSLPFKCVTSRWWDVHFKGFPALWGRKNHLLLCDVRTSKWIKKSKREVVSRKVKIRRSCQFHCQLLFRDLIWRNHFVFSRQVTK